MDQTNIAEYDKYEYDYSTYWDKREYEHNAEVRVLKKIMKNLTGSLFLDVGGSYGRHLPQYHQKFHSCILLDYSLNALKQARESMKKAGIKNVHLILANAYHLPLKTGTFDGAMMIRVMHHLEEPDTAVAEISRVLRPDSHLILEYANKLHLKSIVKALLRLDFKYIVSTEPRKVPTGHFEGAREDDPGIMYNFHPNYILSILVSQGNRVIRTFSLSYFRIPLLKRVIPERILSFFEGIMQSLFSWTKLTPSIIVHAKSNSEKLSQEKSQDLDHILACPKCNEDVEISAGTTKCIKCTFETRKVEGILDLRYPAVER